MNLPSIVNASGDTWGRALLLLCDCAAKGALLLLLAGAGAWLLRRRSAASRHLTWLMAFTGLLLLPALSLLVPQWRLPVLPAATSDRAASFASVRRPAGPFAAQPPAPTIEAPAASPTPVAVSAPQVAQPSLEATPASRRPVPTAVRVLAAWLAGALLVAGQLALGLAIVRRRRRRATPLDDVSWGVLLKALVSSLRLSRPVRLMISRDSIMPMAAGVVRPAILLPREAPEWSAERRRVVLLHELAHVRRLDCLAQPVAHLALALHWFNPLAWWAVRRLTAEREQACDDMVLAAGAAPSSYARQLLEIARTFHAGPLGAAAAVTIARRSQLEGRLLGILDAARPRRAATRRMLAAALFVTAALIFPLASVRLGRAQAVDRQAPDALYKPVAPQTAPTSDVAGAVEDESGRPVAGVEVLAVRGWERDADRRTARSDGDGRFRFAGLKPDGYWFFSVNDPRYGWEWDYERGIAVPAKPPDVPVQITLYDPRTLKGTVVDEGGKPVAGARVVLVNQRVRGRGDPVSGHIDVDFLVARTDVAGRFTLQRLRPGRADFVLEHLEFASTFAVVRVDAREQDAALTIEKGLTLRGRVTHDGKPVAGARVRVGINEGHRPIVDWHGTSGADGRFEAPHVRSLPAEYRSRATSVTAWVQDEKWSSDAYAVYQAGDRELPEVNIDARPVEPGKAAAQRLVEVGKPHTRARAGAAGRVTVELPGAPDGELVFLTSLAAVDRPFDSMLRASAASAVFDSVPPGRYVVSSVGKQARPPQTVEVAAGETPKVTLGPGPCRLKGVVRSGGKPVGGGHVSWFALPGIPRAVFQGGSQPGPDGSYVIEGLTEGAYRLNREATGAMPQTFTVRVGPGESTFDIDLPTGRIEGTLVGRTPKPVDPTGVGSIRICPIGFPPKLPQNSACFTEADAQGRFTIEHVSPGRYNLDGYGLATTLTVGREGSVAAATLRPPEQTGEIAGVVRGVAPPAIAGRSSGGYVTAFARDGQGYPVNVWVHQAQFDPKTGAYRISSVPPGTYGVLVTGAGPDVHVPCTFVPNVEVRPGLSRELTIDIPEGRTVSVVTHDPSSLDPKTAACAGWRLRVPSGDWLDQQAFGVLFDLPLGEYTIEAAYGERGVVRQKFTVERGRDTQRILLRPPNAQ